MQKKVVNIKGVGDGVQEENNKERLTRKFVQG